MAKVQSITEILGIFPCLSAGASQTSPEFRRNKIGRAVSRLVGERPDCDALSGGCNEECFAVLISTASGSGIFASAGCC